MDQAFPSLQIPATGLFERDPGELQLRVDFFRKLGYSPMEVRAALLKLGLSTDTNSVLGELVRSGASTSTSNSTIPESGDDTTGPTSHTGSSMASSRAHGPQRDRPVSSLEDRRDTDSGLKPIVIDGSNVAMRMAKIRMTKSMEARLKKVVKNQENSYARIRETDRLNVNSSSSRIRRT